MTASYLYMPSITALNGHSAAFASISQNVSNLTTSGFKNSETLFSDLVGSKNGSVFGQFSGIKPATRNLIEQQGSIISTNRSLDVAIDGAGFLVTNTAFDGSGETFLTRAGSIDLRRTDIPCRPERQFPAGLAQRWRGWIFHRHRSWLAAAHPG